ncbi:MAG: mechanosensitive ion channel [Candidatus Marinimicrobia bacterium]|nr:mechanosensitive ion channel [Candidatus Neomarinimicrobiota bacterium]
MTELINILLEEENVLFLLRGGFRIILILLIAKIAYSLINKRFRERLNRAQKTSDASRETDKSLMLLPIFQNILKIGIWSIAWILVLGELGINTTALIAGIGMLGIALGLAAQSMIKDLIAGFLLIFENLILVGDSIVVGNISGKVEQVGIRYTKIRLFSGELR